MPYVTLAQLKKALQLATDDNVDDDALRLATEAASSMIDEHCRRRFDQVAGADGTAIVEDRSYNLDSGYVVLDDVATDVGLVVAVDEDGDGVHERVLTAAEYHTLPANALAKGRPIEVLEGLPVTPTTPGAVRVTATFGWPAVPAQVQLAATALALRLFALRGPFGTAGSEEAGQVTLAKAWAAAGAEAQLKPFVRRRLPVVA